jgi:hypothetical protein
MYPAERILRRISEHLIPPFSISEVVRRHAPLNPKSLNPFLLNFSLDLYGAMHYNCEEMVQCTMFGVKKEDEKCPG